MADYKYIRIAVHGQFDGKTGTVYTYPSGNESKWTNLPDPSTIIKNYLNARECYVMWENADGHYFGLITRNPLEATPGYILICLAVKDGFSLTGRQIVNSLSALKKTLLEDGDRFDDAVTRCLQAVGIPANGIELESWKHPMVATTQQPQGLCYRTYMSGQELENDLSFPEQPDYRPYERTVLIPATASLRPGVKMERIVSPLKKTYTVIAPEGVTPSNRVVSDGDRLILTYTKDGFTPRKETVIVGAPSPYVRYEGSAIRVKTAKESGMGFVRRVKLVVKSAKGGEISGYTINVNGRPINTMEPYIDLNEQELKPGSKTEINVASTNYRPLRVVKDSASLANSDTLELVLQPAEQGIVLRLDFGEGRVFEQEISLEKNTPEYSQLHSGNFHGFRASRLATPGGEVYNIDVRSSSKPTPPAFTNVTEKGPAAPTRAKAPVFENISKGSGSGTAGTPEAEAPAKKAKDEKESKPKISFGPSIDLSGNKLGYLIGAGLAVLVLIIAAIFIIPSDNKKPAEEPIEVFGADSTEVSKEQQALAQPKEEKKAEESKKEEAKSESTEEASSAVETDDEKADIAYLNDNKVWDASKLKSPKYKALLSAMRSGDINAMANNEYFSKKGNATNSEAVKAINFLWKSLGTPNQGANVDELKNAASGDRVNIHDLYEALARRQPSKPNTAPRPGTK